MDHLQYKDEIDWKDLTRKPEKLFAFSYLYALAAIVGVGLLYFGNLNTIGRNLVTPQVTIDTSEFVQDIPLQSPRMIPPIDVMQASIPTPAMIEKGHDLYKANCVSCHGESGQGDGPSAAMLTPKPRNFHSLVKWTNGSKISQIFKTLEEGITGSGMASYNYLTPEERFALIHYVRTFSPDQPKDSQETLKQMDAAYQLAKGMNIPGQIPVKKALRLVEREEMPLIKNIQTAILEEHASRSPETELFRRVVFDEMKVFTSVEHMRLKNISEKEFIKAVSADPLGMGFKANVVRLPEKDWSNLYHFVYSMVP
jgi:mono/diheme cytochrome c family protein